MRPGLNAHPARETVVRWADHLLDDRRMSAHTVRAYRATGFRFIQFLGDYRGEEIGKFDKTTLKYCKMAAHASMEAASVPLASEIAWLMQEEHALVNPRAYAGTKEFHK